jgi:tRNA pseudouridine38-40 synthase
MRNIKLTIEYDGTRYHGWQIQPGRLTIQGEIEAALFKVVQARVVLIGAGRTDSGVHAIGQVANFRTTSQHALPIFEKALNRFLPLDIRILEVAEVAPEFHARFDAIYRRYRFVIATKRHALNRHYAWYCKYPLDLMAIRAAAAFFLGQHDFRSFCAGDPGLPHYRCQVTQMQWEIRPDEIHLEIQANRFLHHTVRIMVGTLIAVGRGKIPPTAIPEILAARDRTRAGKTIPPQGLYLLEVGYSNQPDAGLRSHSTIEDDTIGLE